MFYYEPTIAELKNRLARQYGFTVSVGLATNKGVARVASHLRRPSGLTVVPPGRESAFLAPLPIRYLELAPETERSLELLGLTTIGHIARLPRPALVRRFGPAFARIHRLANGLDDDRITVLPLPPEVAAEMMFDFSERAGEVVAYLPQLVDRLVTELRNGNGSVGAHRDAPLHGRVIGLKLYTCDDPIVLSAVLKDYTAQPRLILAAAQKLLAQVPREKPIEGVRLMMTGLEPLRPEQVSMFRNEEATRRAIAAAVEGLKERYGAKTLSRVIYDPRPVLAEHKFRLTEVESDEPTIPPIRARHPQSGDAQRTLLAR